jgi:hypothetical protein
MEVPVGRDFRKYALHFQCQPVGGQADDGGAIELRQACDAELGGRSRLIRPARGCGYRRHGWFPKRNHRLGVHRIHARRISARAAAGGLFGVGLGASKEQWGWLPEDSSDFIFAIIGEELGLVGTLCVTALYGGLAWAGLRVARRAPDTFSRLAAAAITAWIVMQAVVNIGAVIGVFPITGVPLPLVSQGLSSVLVTMVGLGMLMSFARREPGASQALAARGPGAGSRALSWLGRGRRAGPR